MADREKHRAYPRTRRVRGARAREARAALDSLGVDRFRRFLDYLDSNNYGPKAVEIFVRELAEGASVEELLFVDQESDPKYDAGGFNLSAKRLAPDTWRIDFSCTPAPEVGDGADALVAGRRDGAPDDRRQPPFTDQLHRTHVALMQAPSNCWQGMHLQTLSKSR